MKVDLLQGYGIFLEGDEELKEKYNELRAGYQKGLPNRIAEGFERAAEQVALVAYESDTTPRWRDRLRLSIDYENLSSEQDYIAAVFTDKFYAPMQERGTDPYFPNYHSESLVQWAEDHETTAYMVALAIAKRGIRAREFFKAALLASEETVYELVGESVADILEIKY